VVIQEDGEIVAAGSAGGSSETDFALARYLGAGPAIASVSPAAVGQGGTVTATITGSGFLPGAVASVSGSGVSVTSTTYVSPTKVKAHLTVAPDAAPGPRDVTVTDPSGGTGTCPGCLMVDPGPTPTSAAPASGARGAMEYVMISGSGFQPGAQVRFGPGSPCPPPGSCPRGSSRSASPSPGMLRQGPARWGW
jgi:hypothetical protein